jgi:adenylylsulfate kinase
MGAPVQIAVLTGTIGAGKTTLAESLSELLHDRGIRHALIDLDGLGQVYPCPDGHAPYGYELALRNLADIWPNFLETGVTHAVVAGTILDHEQLERLRSALPGAHVTVLLVEAPGDLVHRRIRGRTSGALLDDFLARTDDVAAEIASAAIHDEEITNDQRPPHEVAQQIIERLKWR